MRDAVDATAAEVERPGAQEHDGGRTSTDAEAGSDARPQAPADAGVDDNDAALAPADLGPCDGGRATHCWPDTDEDGYAAGTARAKIECSDKCPAGSTSEAPATGAIDCDDTDANAHPGAFDACNGSDDDCDGTTDEGAAASCALDHAAASCDQGACRIAACSEGYASCDGEQSNGCERSLAAPDSCGKCGVVCDARAACVLPTAGTTPHVCQCNPPLAGDGTSCLDFGSLTIGSGNGVGYLCGLRPDGRVECFGGYAPSHGSSDLFSQIAAGKAHICGIRKDDARTIECFGDSNAQGQLGSGTIGSSGPAFVQVVAGNFHACALLADGSAKCWGGQNVSGDSAKYDYGQAVVPASVQGELHQLSAGAFHTCGLTREGLAICWGAGKTRSCDVGASGCTTADYGQSAAPAGEHFIQVSAGMLHSCGLRANGSVVCWGAGTSSANNGVDLRQGYSQSGPYSLISAGLTQTCGLTLQHKVACWGNAPTLDSSGIVSRVYAGQLVTCELYTNATAQCFTFGSTAPVTLDSLPWLSAL